MTGGLFPKRKPTGDWWRDHSLSIVLGVILAVQLTYSVVAGRREWVGEQSAHQQPTGWTVDWWWWWTYEATMSSLADTYGVLLVVVLTIWLRERDSPESK